LIDCGTAYLRKRAINFILEQKVARWRSRYRRTAAILQREAFSQENFCVDDACCDPHRERPLGGARAEDV
jgi:hypothetical protein